MPRRRLNRALPVLIVLGVGLALVGGRARAQSEAAGADACGAALSPRVHDLWLSLGGANGRLGCPTSGEAAAAPSPLGTHGAQVVFGGGTVGSAILREDSGPHAGQTFAVDGCMWRLYFQYGGTSGWLGFPTSEARNTPDGKRQAFEGGEIVYQRAPDTCSAARSGENVGAPAPAAAGTTRLDLFEDGQGRRLAAASAPAAARAQNDGYRPISTIAFVFTEPGPGLAPLKSYWNSATGDHDAVASADSERADLAAGYEFDGLQGFVWTDPHQGAVPLKRYWNAATRSSLLIADAPGEADAVAKGYVFVRIEGYAPTAP